MLAMGYEPEPPRAGGADQSYLFPAKPKYSMFNAQHYDDFLVEWPARTCDDIDLGDEQGDAGMTDEQRGQKDAERTKISQSMDYLIAMYDERIDKLKSIQQHASRTHQDALVARKLASQEKAMRIRKQMYLAYWNPDVATQWSLKDYWTGFPIRLQKRDGQWIELPSEDDRDVSDEDADDGDDSNEGDV